MQLVGSAARPADSDADRRTIERGIELLRQAIAIVPTNWSAWWIIGKGYQAVGNRPSACDAFGKAYALHKENADVAREYMYECLQIGKPDKAIVAARHVVRVKPDDAGLHSNLALALLLAARLPEAAAAIDEALRLAPQDEISGNLRRLITAVQTGRAAQPKSLAELEGRKQA
jgi:Flp pilus assembly protein TadD